VRERASLCRFIHTRLDSGPKDPRHQEENARINEHERRREPIPFPDRAAADVHLFIGIGQAVIRPRRGTSNSRVPAFR
jgi:hypothetical protein